MQLSSKTANICIRRELGKIFLIADREHFPLHCYIRYFVYTVLSKSNTNLTIFSGYCGIQYNSYSATNPDSFTLDDVTITSVNVSCNIFLNFRTYETQIFDHVVDIFLVSKKQTMRYTHCEKTM